MFFDALVLVAARPEHRLLPMATCMYNTTQCILQAIVQVELVHVYKQASIHAHPVQYILVEEVSSWIFSSFKLVGNLSE